MDLQIVTTLRSWALTERIWFNALWFQTTWFVCVLGRQEWVPLGLGLVALHFFLVSEPWREARRLAPLVAAGIAVDACLSLTGVFDFASSTIIPAWLAVLWVAFATTLNRSLAVLGRYRWLAAGVGGVGVPFNYAVGARFGAVEFPLTPTVTAIILIMVWAILLPNLYRLAALPVREER